MKKEKIEIENLKENLMTKFEKFDNGLVLYGLPTGSGKSYSVNKAIDELLENKNEEDFLFFICSSQIKNLPLKEHKHLDENNELNFFSKVSNSIYLPTKIETFYSKEYPKNNFNSKKMKKIEEEHETKLKNIIINSIDKSSMFDILKEIESRVVEIENIEYVEKNKNIPKDYKFSKDYKNKKINEFENKINFLIDDLILGIYNFLEKPYFPEELEEKKSNKKCFKEAEDRYKDLKDKLDKNKKEIENLLITKEFEKKYPYFLLSYEINHLLKKKKLIKEINYKEIYDKRLEFLEKELGFDFLFDLFPILRISKVSKIICTNSKLEHDFKIPILNYKISLLAKAKDRKSIKEVIGTNRKTVIIYDEFDACKEMSFNVICEKYKVEIKNLITLLKTINSNSEKKIYKNNSFDIKKHDPDLEKLFEKYKEQNEEECEKFEKKIKKFFKTLKKTAEEFKIFNDFIFEETKNHSLLFVGIENSLYSNINNDKIAFIEKKENVNNVEFKNEKKEQEKRLIDLLLNSRILFQKFYSIIEKLGEIYSNEKGVPVEKAKKNLFELWDVWEYYESILKKGFLIKKTKREDDKKESFYKREVSFLKFNNENELSSKIDATLYWTSPEEIMLKLCENNLVIGLSATALINSYSNYDLPFLETNLGKNNFVTVSTTDNELNKNYKKEIKINLITNENIKKISDEIKKEAKENINSFNRLEWLENIINENQSIEILNKLDNIKVKKIILEKFLDFIFSKVLISGDTSEDTINYPFYISRYIVFFINIFNIICDKKTKNILIFTMKQFKKDDYSWSENILINFFDFLKEIKKEIEEIVLIEEISEKDSLELENLKKGVKQFILPSSNEKSNFETTLKQFKKEAQKLEEKCLIFANYQGGSLGLNFQFPKINKENKEFKIVSVKNKTKDNEKDKRFEEIDIDTIYLTEITYTNPMPKNDFENFLEKELDKNDVFKKINFLNRYKNEKDISDYEFEKCVGKLLVTKNNVSDKDFQLNQKIDNSSITSAELFKKLVQAIGRMTRCFNKSKNINICIDYRNLERIKFKLFDLFDKISLTPELIALKNKMTTLNINEDIENEKNESKKKSIETLSKNVENHIKELKNYKDKIIPNIVNSTPKYKQIFSFQKDFVITYPFFSYESIDTLKLQKMLIENNLIEDEIFKKLKGYNESKNKNEENKKLIIEEILESYDINMFYFSCYNKEKERIKSNIYSYEHNYKNLKICFGKEKYKNIVSKETLKQKELENNKEIKNFLSKCSYYENFNNENFMLNFEALDIYKGHIGEKVAQFILQQNGFVLKKLEIENYEYFDNSLINTNGKEFLVDYKNWYTEIKPKDEEENMKKIKRKLNKVNENTNNKYSPWIIFINLLEVESDTTNKITVKKNEKNKIISVNGLITKDSKINIDNLITLKKIINNLE